MTLAWCESFFNVYKTNESGMGYMYMYQVRRNKILLKCEILDQVIVKNGNKNCNILYFKKN